MFRGHSLLFSLVLASTVGAFGFLFQREGNPSLVAGAEVCRPCHEQIYDAYIRTAHFNTSLPADERSIKGSFLESRNVLRTINRDVYFQMEKQADGFYQSAVVKTKSGLKRRSERFDFVVGSGRKGQTYLYWKEGLLFQLPVSYLTVMDRWVNSPGIPDGTVLFERIVPPRCLECHTTFFHIEKQDDKWRYGPDHVLGISCEKCHGSVKQHVEYHRVHSGEAQGKYILNPKNFSRERQIDNCALCHSGLREPKRPSFSYVPGDSLDDYLMRESGADDAQPDVHGNQVALMKLSRCFSRSSEMTCSTCHDVHRQERDLNSFSRKCMLCHSQSQCPVAAEQGEKALKRCIDCHMPNQPSRVITVQGPAGMLSPLYRNHAIRIYPEETKKTLKLLAVP